MIAPPTGKGRIERPDIHSGLILTPLTLSTYFSEFSAGPEAPAIFADLANLRDGLREHADDSRRCIKHLCGVTRRAPGRFFKLLVKIRETLDSDDTSLAINTLDQLLNLRQRHQLTRGSRLLCQNRPARDGEMILMNLDGELILAHITLTPGAVEGFTVKQISKDDSLSLTWRYLYEIFAVVLRIEQEGGERQ
jgi:hypothetical protein